MKIRVLVLMLSGISAFASTIDIAVDSVVNPIQSIECAYGPCQFSIGFAVPQENQGPLVSASWSFSDTQDVRYGLNDFTIPPGTLYEYTIDESAQSSQLGLNNSVSRTFLNTVQSYFNASGSPRDYLQSLDASGNIADTASFEGDQYVLVSVLLSAELLNGQGVGIDGVTATLGGISDDASLRVDYLVDPPSDAPEPCLAWLLLAALFVIAFSGRCRRVQS